MSFDLQPVLQGELLGLRPIRPEDFYDLYAVASDPLIWEQHPVKDRYKEEVFKRFFREALESGGALIAIDSSDGQVIGSSRFHGYRQGKKRDRNRLDVLGQNTLGRYLQQGNETADATACLPIRQQRCLSRRSAEFALAEGHGKSRRRPCRIEARRGRPGQFRLPDYCFSVYSGAVEEQQRCK